MFATTKVTSSMNTFTAVFTPLHMHARGEEEPRCLHVH